MTDELEYPQTIYVNQMPFPDLLILVSPIQLFETKIVLFRKIELVRGYFVVIPTNASVLGRKEESARE